MFKDKVITGISGGEWGVRGFLAAYDINTGKQVWLLWSTPARTGNADRSGQDHDTDRWHAQARWQGLVAQDLEGDWVVGGGTTWGWYSYDKALNLLLRNGQLLNVEPGQRPGDNKWSMTIFARDVDTGMAKWAYQMTPYDSGLDGVNEMILADITSRASRPRRWCISIAMASATHSIARRCAAGRRDDPRQLGDHVDMKTGRPQVVDKY